MVIDAQKLTQKIIVKMSFRGYLYSNGGGKECLCEHSKIDIIFGIDPIGQVPLYQLLWQFEMAFKKKLIKTLFACGWGRAVMSKTTRENLCPLNLQTLSPISETPLPPLPLNSCFLFLFCIHNVYFLPSLSFYTNV